MATVTTNHEKYSRLALMLVKGGTKVTRALFEKRYKAMSPKDHIPFPWTIDEFLQANKKTILSKQTGRNKEWIFFSVASGTEIDKWDLLMFCFVLVDVCGVSAVIRMDVDQLKNMRNKLCHLSEPTVETVMYDINVLKIKFSFERLLKEIGDQLLTEEISNLLHAAEEGPLSLQDTLNVMHQFYSMEGDTRQCLSNLSEDIKAMMEKMKEMDRKLDLVVKNQKANTTEAVKVSETFIELLVKNCVSEKEVFISKLLVNMYKEVTGGRTDALPNVDYSNMFAAVRDTVERFTAKDRPIVDAEEKCVSLRIKCTSVASLVSLFDDCIAGDLNKEFKPLEACLREIKGCEEVSLEAVMFEDDVWKTISKTISSMEEMISRWYSTAVQSSIASQNSDIPRISDVNLVERRSPSTEDDKQVHHAVRLTIRSDQVGQDQLKQSIKNGSLDSSINRLKEEIVDQCNLTKLSIEARILDKESPSFAGVSEDWCERSQPRRTPPPKDRAPGVKIKGSPQTTNLTSSTENLYSSLTSSSSSSTVAEGKQHPPVVDSTSVKHGNCVNEQLKQDDYTQYSLSHGHYSSHQEGLTTADSVSVNLSDTSLSSGESGQTAASTSQPVPSELNLYNIDRSRGADQVLVDIKTTQSTKNCKEDNANEDAHVSGTENVGALSKYIDFESEYTTEKEHKKASKYSDTVKHASPLEFEDKMATVTTNHEKYSNLALMLVKGGTKVTRALFEKSFKAMTPEDHVPFPWTLDEFIQANKKKILFNQTGRFNERIFFPGASGTKIDHWNLSLFCFVLVDICEVSATIRIDVNQLKKMRNKLLHLSEPSVDDNTYERYVGKIKIIFDRLLSEIDDHVLSEEIGDLLQAAIAGPCSFQDTLKNMHTFYFLNDEMREMLSQQSKEISEIMEISRENTREQDIYVKKSNQTESVKVPGAFQNLEDIKTTGSTMSCNEESIIEDIFVSGKENDGAVSKDLVSEPDNRAENLRKNVSRYSDISRRATPLEGGTKLATLTTNHEKYKRLALLIVKGGTKITRALFEKSFQAMTPEDHVPFPWTIDEFLQANKEKILSNQTGRAKERIIFSVASGTKIDHWDLYTFCYVLVDICEVSATIRMYVDQLKKMRNKLCHMSEPSVDDEQYNLYLNKIKVIFDRLLAEIDDRLLQREIDDLIEAVKEGPLPLQNTFNLMHTFSSMEGEILEMLSQQRKEIKEVTAKLRGMKRNVLYLKHLKETEAVKVPDLLIEGFVKDCASDKEEFILKFVDMFEKGMLSKEDYYKMMAAVKDITAQDSMVVNADQVG